MEKNTYVILVRENGTEKYLFNRRSLVSDIAFARRFSDLTQAKHYFSRSIFTSTRYQIEPVAHEEPQVDPKNPGAIVE